MASNVRLQQNKPKRFCLKCKIELITSSWFNSPYCSECGRLAYEQRRKTERALNESYCPFCHMLLAEHKQDEAQLCLYNLRGYVIQKVGSVE